MQSATPPPLWRQAAQKNTPEMPDPCQGEAKELTFQAARVAASGPIRGDNCRISGTKALIRTDKRQFGTHNVTQETRRYPWNAPFLSEGLGKGVFSCLAGFSLVNW